MRLISFAAGVATGAVVTKRLHERPPGDFWARPVGELPLRRADLPLGGLTALGIAALLPPSMGRQLRAVGFGAIAGCLAVAVRDPYRG
jgi:hypothetical protein